MLLENPIIMIDSDKLEIMLIFWYIRVFSFMSSNVLVFHPCLPHASHLATCMLKKFSILLTLGFSLKLLTGMIDYLKAFKVRR